MMLLAVCLIPALLVGMFLGYQFKRDKKCRIENLKKGSVYQFFAGGGKILNHHYVMALIPLGDSEGIPRWYRCLRPLPPGGHTYLRAVSVNGEIVLTPSLFKTASVQAPLLDKA